VDNLARPLLSPNLTGRSHQALTRTAVMKAKAAQIEKISILAEVSMFYSPLARRRSENKQAPVIMTSFNRQQRVNFSKK
jgi:hypothetical protein